MPCPYVIPSYVLLMRYLLGIFRILVTVLILVPGTVLILILGLLPLRYKGARWSSWVVNGLCRLFFPIFGMKLTCNDREAIIQHHGLVFPNHESYIDPILMMAVWPMRFMGMAEVRWWPFIGWIAMAMDTVFVKRHDKAHRKQARQEAAEKLRARTYPPLSLFPEGGIGVGDELLPFRYGAFEIAAEVSLPFMPAVIHYDRFDVIAWFKEPLLVAVWRLAINTDPINAKLVVLPVVTPHPEDDPAELARATATAIDETFQALGGAIGLSATDSSPAR